MIRRGVMAAFAPISYLAAFCVLILIWQFFDWPSGDELFDTLSSWFLVYGLPIVAVAAFVEGVALITLYFPGSSVIVASVLAYQQREASTVPVISVVSLSFILAAQVNYLVGYFGLHRLISRFGGEAGLKAARERYRRFGNVVIPPSFVHPALGGFMAVSVGSARLRWRRFFVVSAASIVGWNMFWGFVVQTAGATMREAATNPLIVVTGLGFWALGAFAYGLLSPPKASSGL